MPENLKKIKKALILLIIISTLMRLLTAHLLELSVDEVYYWLYAVYPDWSYFDHPPMVGWVIQLFTLNLLFDSELFLRLGPVLFAALNTWLIFKIGMKIKDPLTGLYAAFLYNASIYASVLSGVFIIPDAPLILFWLSSLWFLLNALPTETIDRKSRLNMLAAGIAIGLAGLSKYHGAFIGIGVILYVLIYDRRWLKEPSLWLAGLAALILITPVIYWNYQHDFISFGFHTGRVRPAMNIRPDYFFTEIVGQFAYNNPFNYVIFAGALIAWYRGRHYLNEDHFRLLLLNGLPLWIVFTSFSLFRSTLPHWTGPAFIPLIITGAAWLSSILPAKHTDQKKLLFPSRIKAPVYLIATLLILAIFVINYLPAGLGKKGDIKTWGENDFTQDMYGWDQVAANFLKIYQHDTTGKIMPPHAPLITFRYFPAAHFDYYFAYHANIPVYVFGPIDRAHEYYWINKFRGPVKKGQDVYYLAVSNWYKDPEKLFGTFFDEIEQPEIFEVRRSGVVVRYGLLYRMRGFKGNFNKNQTNININ